MEAVDDVLHAEYGARCGWEPVFAAESDSQKRQFLVEQFENGLIFENTKDLSLNFAMDVRSGVPRLVPQAKAFGAGFSCVSRSPCNNGRQQFKHCLRQATPCPTQETYEMSMAYIRSARPMICWLENVKELQEGTEETNDLEYIKCELTELGYYTQAWVIDALQYGSAARRKRLYILAVQLDESIKNSPEHHLWLEQFCERFLNVTKIGSLKTSDFVDMASFQQGEPISKFARLDAQFRDEHSAFYRAAGLKWPPLRSSLAHVSVIDMTERHVELAALLDALFPRPETLDAGAQELADVNLSAGRLLDANAKTIASKEEFKKNPWTATIPTLTGSSVILMRWILPGGQKPVLRLLTSLEIMAVMGWSKGMWATGTSEALKQNRSLLCDLAGNAFSGFSFAPLVVLGAAVAGCTAEVIRLARPIQERVAEISIDSSDDGSQ